jgi:hypothetical protein
MKIYCCECRWTVEAVLTSGAKVYPYRKDLSEIPFWECPTCENFVGCHYKTKDPTRPLGTIPSPEIKDVRKLIHKNLDPLWKDKLISRSKLYKKLSDHLGYFYHTASVNTVAEASKVLKWVANDGWEK